MPPRASDGFARRGNNMQKSAGAKRILIVEDEAAVGLMLAEAPIG
jgi:hypothetical protein